MIAEQPSTSVQEPRADRAESVQPISLQRVVAELQVVLATRRAAVSDDYTYWYTIARGM
jgi:hypothetical protein